MKRILREIRHKVHEIPRLFDRSDEDGRVRGRGYTLGEVIMAMALLMVILTFLAGLFTHLFVSSSKSLDSSIALELADSVISQANDSDPATWPALAASQSLYNRDPRSTTEFHTVLSFPPAPVMTHDMGQMYEVSVEVYWMGDRPSETRRDYGRQSVRLSKIIYVSNMQIAAPPP
ncbi:MAG: hypothetical protein J0I12_29730 [Candidatus Eremiobacteraeota bacterium]|nr:hypothetical protein [Candidatus Eremiobacteraeota bacterium]